VDIEKTTLAFDPPTTFPAEGIVLSTGSPRHYHIGTECTLYILNGTGKTIDKLGCTASPKWALPLKKDYSAGLPRARSIREWVSGREFLALKHGLHPEQLKVLSRFFGELCPYCSSFETDGTVPILDNGKCGFCGRFWSLENLPQELCAIWGSRSGKGFVAAVACSYILHRLLCIHDLLRYYQLPEKETCVYGLIGDNHPRFVWDTLLRYLKEAPWFKECYAAGGFLPKSKKLSFPNGLVLKFLSYKQGVFPSGHIAFGCFSELGANAPTLFNLAEKGAELVRKSEDAVRRAHGLISPGGLLLSFSTPTGSDSFLKERLEKAKAGKRVVVSHLPTWEVNPRFSEDELRDSAPDEIRFRRDFGAEIF
jgi:hypothetical protein